MDIYSESSYNVPEKYSEQSIDYDLKCFSLSMRDEFLKCEC